MATPAKFAKASSEGANNPDDRYDDSAPVRERAREQLRNCFNLIRDLLEANCTLLGTTYVLPATEPRATRGCKPNCSSAFEQAENACMPLLVA